MNFLINLFKGLDIKSWLILILLGFGLFFFYMWYFRGPSNKGDINKLKRDIEIIQKERDSLKVSRSIMVRDFSKLRQKDSTDMIEIYRLDIVISNMKDQANKDKSNFLKLKKDLDDTRKKIDELKKTPSNRSGDDLLNSLKNKAK